MDETKDIGVPDYTEKLIDNAVGRPIRGEICAALRANIENAGFELRVKAVRGQHEGKTGQLRLSEDNLQVRFDANWLLVSERDRGTLVLSPESVAILRADIQKRAIRTAEPETQKTVNPRVLLGEAPLRGGKTNPETARRRLIRVLEDMLNDGIAYSDSLSIELKEPNVDLLEELVQSMGLKINKLQYTTSNFGSRYKLEYAGIWGDDVSDLLIVAFNISAEIMQEVLKTLRKMDPSSHNPYGIIWRRGDGRKYTGPGPRHDMPEIRIMTKQAILSGSRK